MLLSCFKHHAMMMFVRRARVGMTTLILTSSQWSTRCTGFCTAKQKVRVNLDTILAIKAKNCHGMIHNNIFKNIKLLNVSGLTGPSTGSILIAV